MVSRYLSLMLVMPSMALALTPMDDNSLSRVRGQDGMTVDLQSMAGIHADNITWETDSGVTDQQARTHFRQVDWQGDGGPLHATLDIDAGSQGTDPLLSLAYRWQPGFYHIGGFSLETQTNGDYQNHSLGELGLYSSGHINLVNAGIFNAASNQARFDFAMGGDLILRQGGAGTPELSFANLVLNNRFTTGAANGHQPGSGTVGITDQGLLLKAEHTYTDFSFDLMYKESPTNFDRFGRSPLLHAGWQGGLTNAVFQVQPGGVSYATDANGNMDYLSDRSEGLLLRSQWDYDTDFGLVLGLADGDRTRMTLGGWQKLGNSSGPMLSMDVVLDILQNNVGPAGLCLGSSLAGAHPGQAHCQSDGGEFIDTRVPAGDSAFAMLLRNGALHGYSSTMKVNNPTTGWNHDYNFGLVLTLGQLDADILIYPRGAYQSLDGMKMDINLIAQSPGYWEKANSDDPQVRATAADHWQDNSQLMFTNTSSNVGLGILNNDVLWQTRDMYLRIGEQDPLFQDMKTGIMLSSDTFARYYLRGLFGAGDISNLGEGTANVALWQFNLAATRYRFVMYPSSQDIVTPSGTQTLSTLGFEGFFDLDPSSFLSLAEVSAPKASFNLYNVTGTLGWKEGNVVLKSGDQNADGNPSLTLENQLLIGQGVDFGNGAGTPMIGNVGFGDQNYGRIAMPGGIWHSEIVAKIPTP